MVAVCKSVAHNQTDMLHGSAKMEARIQADSADSVCTLLHECAGSASCIMANDCAACVPGAPGERQVMRTLRQPEQKRGQLLTHDFLWLYKAVRAVHSHTHAAHALDLHAISHSNIRSFIHPSVHPTIHPFALYSFLHLFIQLSPDGHLAVCMQPS